MLVQSLVEGIHYSPDLGNRRCRQQAGKHLCTNSVDEKEAGQRLEVDLELHPNDDRAERSDRLGDAVDYDALYHTVRGVVEQRSFHLLETLAATTAETILERFAVRRVRVRIAKQNLGWTTGGRAVIEVTRERKA
jgi:dihydroneopterin aldolase